MAVAQVDEGLEVAKSDCSPPASSITAGGAVVRVLLGESLQTFSQLLRERQTRHV